MTDYVAPLTDIAVHNKSLAANTEDTVRFLTDSVALPSAPCVQVLVTSGSAPVYFTTDGTPATVGGGDTILVQPNTSAYVRSQTRPPYIRLISSAVATYSVMVP